MRKIVNDLLPLPLAVWGRRFIPVQVIHPQLLEEKFGTIDNRSNSSIWIIKRSGRAENRTFGLLLHGTGSLEFGYGSDAKASVSNFAGSGAAAAAARERQDLMRIVKWTGSRKQRRGSGAGAGNERCTPVER
ncbi:hypothetical protein ACJJTC_014058 [Scirpophaga incertulas]